MKLALFQMNVIWEDKDANLKKIKTLEFQIAGEKPDILILPEMFATGFSMNVKLVAEDLDGITVSFLRDFAKINNIWIVAGLVLKAKKDKGKNVAMVIDRNGDIAGIYTKIKLFSLQDEHIYHEAGISPVVLNIEGLRLSPFVCYDLRFPELFRRVARDVELIVVIASWPGLRQDHWDTLLKARAIENQLFVAGVNRVGEGGGLSFLGGSAIYDPLGNCLIRSEGREELLTHSIDRSFVREVRSRYPFLQDS